jgi:RNA polymerase sigma-70 factor (ECF subfamily)
MDERGELREKLLRLIKRKFWSRPGISDYADDIVNEAFLKLFEGKNYSPDKESFAYLSVVCTRIAFKYFKKGFYDTSNKTCIEDCLNFIDEEDFVDDILKNEDASAVLESLDVLKEIERVVITQRYYGNFTFAEIAEANNINLNTILSHHRRALEKLRPVLTKYLDFSETEGLLNKSSTSNYFTKFF